MLNRAIFHIKDDIRTIYEKDPAAKNIVEVLLCYPKEHIDDMGEECKGYVFHIDSIENNGFGICINFTDWRDTKKEDG